MKLFLNFLVISFLNPPLILPLKDIRYNLKCKIVIDISQHNNRSNNFNQFTPVTVLLFFLRLLTFSFPISFLLLRKFIFLFILSKVFMKFNSKNRKILKLLFAFLLCFKTKICFNNCQQVLWATNFKYSNVNDNWKYSRIFKWMSIFQDFLEILNFLKIFCYYYFLQLFFIRKIYFVFFISVFTFNDAWKWNKIRFILIKSYKIGLRKKMDVAVQTLFS